MDEITILLAVLAGLALVASVALLVERQRLVAERDLARARLADEERMRQGFQAVASDVLRGSNEEFLRLAKATFAADRAEAAAAVDARRSAVERLVDPIRDWLERTHAELRRVGEGHVGLLGEVRRMERAHRELRGETGRLVQALRKPNVRGRYGEVQLERVIELAGMRAWCDFAPQEAVAGEERLRRPDVVVKLPNARRVAIDAKTSFDAYLDALDASTPDEAEAALARHAEHVARELRRLARKRYAVELGEDLELVVMFLPGDQLVDAALERRPDLVGLAAENDVVLASPSTLIGLLRAIHVGWREKNLSDGAEELYDLGRELHRRAALVLERAGRMGTALDAARKSYNEFVGSVQGRLLPTLRRFEERDARSSRELVPPAEVEGEVRVLAPEVADSPPEAADSPPEAADSPPEVADSPPEVADSPPESPAPVPAESRREPGRRGDVPSARP